MRIRQLHINRFGHFNECDLAFSSDGLQVIYGPNEAGKTTLLEFLRGLLFDFPTRTPYDFGGQGEMAGVATIELKDGRSVELRRRKGIKDKVSIKLDGQPTDLGDVGWLRLLDHADRGLFESVFAFGLDKLSLGEESLKHESLQSALFGGSLGGTTSPDKVIAELSRQADELFKKGGSRPAINVLLAELKKLSKEIKDSSLRPEKYHETEGAMAKAIENAQAFHQKVDQLRREHAKVEKRARAWPIWNELKLRRVERAGLTVPANIPVDARQRYQGVSKEMKTIAEERLKRTIEITQASQIVATLKLDPSAVSYRAEIKSFLELRQSFIDAREELPDVRRQRDAMRLLIDRELAELRPGWTHDDLQAFSVDVATRAETQRLSDERIERTKAIATLIGKRDGDVANLERTREELAENGSPPDITSRVAVLADEADFVANRKQQESSRGELAKLERKFTAQCRKLMPPLPTTVQAPEKLSVPRAETVTDFKSRFAEFREKLQLEIASVEEDEVEQRQIESSLAIAMSSHAIPSLDERDSARVRRDAGWNLVRQKYILAQGEDSEITAWLNAGADSFSDPDLLPNVYQRAVQVADDIADQIYGNANKVAEREGLRRQYEALTMRIVPKRQRIAEFESQQAELQLKWLVLWQPCGFEPLSPDAMLGWLNDRESVCATVTKRDELNDELSQLAESVDSFEQRLQAAWGKEGDNVSALLNSVKQSVDDAKNQQRRIGELQKDIRRLEKQVTKHDDELQNLKARETSATAEWQAVLVRLNLPSHWNADLAREVIDKLSATRVRLDALPGEDARIAAMQKRIEEFEQGVSSLCGVLASDLLRDPPELAIEKLTEQVERAVEAQRKHDDLSQELSVAREQLKLLDGRQAEQESERARLFALAGVSVEEEYFEVVSQAENVVRLHGEIEQLEREVDLIRAGDDLDEFVQSLSGSELAMLQGMERDLREELKAAEALRKGADGDEAIARDSLLRLDGSATVAILTEELSRKRSLLAAEVDRYMPLVYARHLLNSAVSRFEKENQPEMISTVSRLLGQITGGRYVEFDRTSGSKQTVLIRRADGVERTPDQLSTGTREQLYLAIRLAYVIHYCQQNQPLPIIVDDVLVNFDDARAKQTLSALADISKSVQVLFFTCHPHMVTLARGVVPGLIPVDLKATSDRVISSVGSK